MIAARLARLEQAFRVACGELGHCSAGWLFVREVALEGGAASVEGLRDGLGRAFPVLDAVARRWLEGATASAVEVEPLLAACAGESRVLVVGVEATLAQRLPPHAVYVGLALSVCAGSSLFLTAATSGPMAQALTERAHLRDAAGQPLRFGFAEFLPVGLLSFSVIQTVAIGWALLAVALA